MVFFARLGKAVEVGLEKGIRLTGQETIGFGKLGPNNLAHNKSSGSGENWVLNY